MKDKKHPTNKIFVILSVFVMLFGILVGTILIFSELDKYFNSISKYTEQDKVVLENTIKDNEEKYNEYLEQIQSLTKEKEQYQFLLSDLKNTSAEYILYQEKISEISKELETLDSEKYTTLSEKNNLQKEYINVIEALNKKENSYYLISCYFLGFIVIIGGIIIGIVLLSKAYKPDFDDIILEQQKKIDESNPPKKKSTAKKKTTSKKSANQDTNKLPKLKEKAN